MLKRRGRGFGLALAAALALLVLAGAACGGGGGEGKPTISLVEQDWTSQLIETIVLEKILNDQLGYKTERVKLAVSATWPAMCRGEVDASVEAWLPSRLAELQPFLDQNCIELGGEIFPGGGGWVVPSFVVKGDPERGIQPMAPGLNSILDLKDPKIWKLFENPEKPGMGELVGGSPGWVDDYQDRSMIKGYDLPIWRSNQSEPIMMARMIAADKKGEPLLLYIWWPHWIFSKLDLHKLQWPDPWRDDCFADEEAPYKCPHPAYSVHTVVSQKLKEKAPEVATLVSNMEFGEDEINGLMLRVDVDGEDVGAVAADWVAANQARINGWLGK